MMEGEQWAFPHGNYALQHGMTLLDWYAGMAMQGYLASYGGMSESPDFKRAAEAAWAYAHEMLAERERRMNASKTP